MDLNSSTENLYRRQPTERRQDFKDSHITTVVSNEVNGSVDAEKASIDWAPGFWNRFPWIGFCALLTMLTCVALTIVVLKTSHDKAKEEWPAIQNMTLLKDHATWASKAQIKPSVALAVINTVANIALAVLIGQGVAISWWRSALEGATVQDLHKSWGFSTSVLELLTAGRKFNLIALAALAAKMALLDNLLLQQAADNIPSIFTQPDMNIRLPAVREFPANYAGTWNASAGNYKGASSLAFSNDIRNHLNSPAFIEYGNGASTGDIDTHCIGSCTASVIGFGFNITCDPEEEFPSALEFLITPESVLANEAFLQAEIARENAGNYSQIDVPTMPSLLRVEIQYLDAGFNSYPQHFPFDTLQIITDYSRLVPNEGNASSCTGKVFEKRCYLQPATVEYPIEFTNFSGNPLDKGNPLKTTRTGLQILDFTDDATLPDPIDGLSKGQIQEIKVIAPIPTTNTTRYTSNMLSIYNAAKSLYGTGAYGVPLSYLPGKGYTIGGNSESAMQSWWIQVTSAWETTEKCELDVVDPMHYIISQINSLMLRASIHAAVDPTDSTKLLPGALQDNIPAMQVIDTVRYQSHEEFMWAAIALMLACVVCVLPSYWRFWELGRKVTLGPIEISSAFQAPVLAHPGLASGGEVDILLKEVGNRRIRYGEVQGEGRLGMAEPDAVIKLTRK